MKESMYRSAGKAWFDSRDLIGIFDLDITSQSRLTREYLKAAQLRGTVLNAAEDLPRTFLVCKEKVILSHLSSGILRQRTEKE